MGVLVDESMVSSSEEFLGQSDFKDGKKKKRRQRKSKPTLSACSSVSEICTDASTSSNHMMSNGHQHMPHECNTDEETKFSNSVPETGISFVAVEPVETVLIARPVDYISRRTYFPPHRSVNSVSKALEKGELLRALFRVNAYNRLEAYCKIDGVEVDVLVSGAVAQNRAIEGDTVAIVIDPPSLWPRMKGSSGTLSSSASNADDYCEVLINGQDGSRGKSKFALDCEYTSSSNCMNVPSESSSGVTSDNVHRDAVPDCHGSMSLLAKLCCLISLNPSKRPTGKVVAIIEKSFERQNVVGFLSIKQWLASRDTRKKSSRKNKTHLDNIGFLLLNPTDPKFPKMTVPVKSLPESIKHRLEIGDLMVESFLVGAKVVEWAEELQIPNACVVRAFGRGCDGEAQIAAMLFENALDVSDFSPEALSCVPDIPWEVPPEEFVNRKDLRGLCVFTIDPGSAVDLDDALSVEKLPDGIFRVGVHIADASYFVPPDTALDVEALVRSTSVYLSKHTIPMLPPVLSDNLASLKPGVDRLTFSIFWDIDHSGEAVNRWIGRTIVRSCCKLSYEHAQDIIDGAFDFQGLLERLPELHGLFGWQDVIGSVKSLHEISRVLRENRLRNGALLLESPTVAFLYDDDGIPYDITVARQVSSNILVEELMLLANTTAAEVILRAYPSSALLRKHPKPNARKLREFEAFCSRHGFELDTSSSMNLHRSLEHIKEELKDFILFDILMCYASRSMQIASYFCSGDLKDTDEYTHYALAVPLYTHFTSPLRRYPDIVVHRTLAAAMEAEDVYLKGKMNRAGGQKVNICFSGSLFERDEIDCVEAREALSMAATKYRVPDSEILAGVVAHCNKWSLLNRRVKDAADKLYIWILLKKKEILYSEARVLGLGPKFMSLYIPMVAMERRIYYDEVDSLTAEWLDATSTLVLSQSSMPPKRSTVKNSPGKCRAIEEVALVVSPTEPGPDTTYSGENDSGLQRCGPGRAENEPAFFPLTVHILSTIPIALHAIGGDDGPIDVVARLYMCSYFH